MATEEELQEIQRQQHELREHLKAQLDQSDILSVQMHFDVEQLEGNVKRVITSDDWQITITGRYRDKSE